MKSRSMTRPCLCGLAGPWRLFGFTAREAMGGAPSFDSVSRNLGPRGLPPTFTSGILGAGGSKIQGGRRGPLRVELRHEGRARDRGRLPVVPLRVGERLVDLLERVLVREEPVERPARPVAHEEVERARDDPRIVLDDAHDRLRPPDEQRRLELDLGAAADRADLEVRAPRAEHLDTLWDYLGKADEVTGDVRAGSARPPPHERDALLAVGDLVEVDRVVGAERLRQLEPPREPIDDDHRRRAHVPGDRRRLDPEAAGALDHDAPAEGQARLVEPEDHL